MGDICGHAFRCKYIVKTEMVNVRVLLEQQRQRLTDTTSSAKYGDLPKQMVCREVFRKIVSLWMGTVLPW